MNSYRALSGFYDDLTQDVPYEDFADYYMKLFAADGGEFHTLLDLCCGTGTLACLMAARGYEMIAADASPDMLTAASAKAAELKEGIPPLFICQEAAELDLYGTVDAAYSSLDSLSYVPPGDMPEVFRRLRLFIRPSGLLIFDLRTPDFLCGMDGEVCVDETEDVLCLWRGRFDEALCALVYGMDIFERRGEIWLRKGEEHIEYAHEPDAIRAMLCSAGFREVSAPSGSPPDFDGRLFFIAKRV